MTERRCVICDDSDGHHWIGIFWQLDTWYLDVYVCILPCLPLQVRWYRTVEG